MHRAHARAVRDRRHARLLRPAEAEPRHAAGALARTARRRSRRSARTSIARWRGCRASRPTTSRRSSTCAADPATSCTSRSTGWSSSSRSICATSAARSPSSTSSRSAPRRSRRAASPPSTAIGSPASSRSRRAIRRRTSMRTSLGLSVMNARLTSQGGFAGGRGGWLVSMRPGYLDVALKLTSVRDSIRPRYYDLFAKAQYDLGRGGRVAMHVLRASDTFRYLQKDDPNIASDYASNYAWLTWDDNFGSRLTQSTVLSTGVLNWRRDGDESQERSPLGAHQRPPVAGSRRAAAGLELRRHAERDAEVGTRREARGGDVRLLQRRARHEECGQRRRGHDGDRDVAAHEPTRAVRRAARAAAAVAHHGGRGAARSQLAGRRVDRQPAAQPVVGAARRDDGARSVGPLQSVAAALLPAGPGRRERVRARGERRAAHPRRGAAAAATASRRASRRTTVTRPTRVRCTPTRAPSCGRSPRSCGTACASIAPRVAIAASSSRRRAASAGGWTGR